MINQNVEFCESNRKKMKPPKREHPKKSHLIPLFASHTHIISPLFVSPKQFIFAVIRPGGKKKAADFEKGWKNRLIAEIVEAAAFLNLINSIVSRRRRGRRHTGNHTRDQTMRMTNNHRNGK